MSIGLSSTSNQPPLGSLYLQRKPSSATDTVVRSAADISSAVMNEHAWLTSGPLGATPTVAGAVTTAPGAVVVSMAATVVGTVAESADSAESSSPPHPEIVSNTTTGSGRRARARIMRLPCGLGRGRRKFLAPEPVHVRL